MTENELCMHKRFLFSLIIILFFCSNIVFCDDAISLKLKNIEQVYYGYNFDGDNNSRLTRLEKEIYGKPSNQNEKTRVDKLYNDLMLSNSNSSVPQKNKNFLSPVDIGPKADSDIKYPIVDMLEEKTFNKSFENDEIYSRLSRLENKVFSNSINNAQMSLNERVDALKSKILGQSHSTDKMVYINPDVEEIILENGKKYVDENNKYSFLNNNDSNYNYYRYEDYKSKVPEIDKQNNFASTNYGQNYDLDILEKSLLGKNYTSEAPSQRLARLETKVFSRTFTDDSQARIQRLLAVTTAQKTSQEYDSNKWARRLNAGMQIGSILLMVLAMIL